jgi:hypothetical protein
VHYATPEDPDALALDIKESNAREPGALVLSREPVETGACEMDQPIGKLLERGLGWQHF